MCMVCRYRVLFADHVRAHYCLQIECHSLQTAVVVCKLTVLICRLADVAIVCRYAVFCLQTMSVKVPTIVYRFTSINLQRFVSSLQMSVFCFANGILVSILVFADAHSFYVCKRIKKSANFCIWFANSMSENYFNLISVCKQKKNLQTESSSTAGSANKILSADKRRRVVCRFGRICEFVNTCFLSADK